MWLIGSADIITLRFGKQQYSAQPRTQVWDDAIQAGCQLDCRICTTLIEVCTRKGLTDRALSTYEMMKNAPSHSKMAPTVHAYTAAMRAAAEGGQWERALNIWSDMEAAQCPPSGMHFSRLPLPQC